MVSMLDRGDSYRVEFLGSAMLSQVGTGLGVLQKPLRELYFGFRMAGKHATLQERHLTITSRGLTMTFRERPDSRTVEEEFYSVPSIVNADAVQFVTVRGQDKKVRAAFEPIDNDLSRNKINLFSMVEKQYHFIQQFSHPPLFCVVLRRTQGVKALDVHAFVCSTDEEALGLVRAINQVHSNFLVDESIETGVFAYNPFGKESLRSAGSFERQLGQNSGSYERRQGQMDSPSAGHPPPVRVLPSPSHGRATGRQVQREIYPPDNMVRTPSQTNLAAPGTTFQLTQDDFVRGAPKYITAEDVHQSPSASSSSRRGFDNMEHLELDRNRPYVAAHDGPRLQSDILQKDVRNLRSVGKKSSASYLESASASPPPGRKFDSVTNNIDFGEGRESPRSARYTAESKTGQGYGILSGGQGPSPGRSARNQYEDNEEDPYRYRGRRDAGSSRSGNRPSTIESMYEHSLPRRSSPPRGDQIFMEDTRWRASDVDDERDRRVSPRSPDRREDHTPIKRSVPVGGQRVFPRGGEPPPVVPQTTRPSALGRSPSIHEHVPPPSAAGKKSPGSGYRQSQYEGVESPGPSGSNRDSNYSRYQAGREEFPRDREERGERRSQHSPPGRGFGKDSPVTPNKPVAMVTPQKLHGVKVLPTLPVLPKQRTPELANDVSPTKPTSRPKSLYNIQEGELSEPRRGDNVRGGNTNDEWTQSAGKKAPSNSKQKNTNKLRNELAGNWQFNRSKTDDKNGSKKGQSPGDQDGGDSTMNEKLLMTKKKDAEIASVMQNLKFDYQENTISPHGTNFERSLGYFP